MAPHPEHLEERFFCLKQKVKEEATDRQQKEWYHEPHTLFRNLCMNEQKHENPSLSLEDIGGKRRGRRLERSMAPEHGEACTIFPITSLRQVT